MTFKQRLENRAKKEHGLTKKQTGQFLDILASEVFDILAAGEAVRIPGVGSLVLVDRPEQFKHNPKGGGKVLVPAGKRVKFRKSSALDYLLEIAD